MKRNVLNDVSPLTPVESLDDIYSDQPKHLREAIRLHNCIIQNKEYAAQLHLAIFENIEGNRQELDETIGNIKNIIGLYRELLEFTNCKQKTLDCVYKPAGQKQKKG